MITPIPLPSSLIEIPVTMETTGIKATLQTGSRISYRLFMSLINAHAVSMKAMSIIIINAFIIGLYSNIYYALCMAVNVLLYYRHIIRVRNCAI